MAAQSLFGTDGIRGKANQYPMNSEFLLALARTIAQQLLPRRPAKVVIGKDTRVSGYMLETALTSGLVSEGVNVIFTGPVPTPAIPLLVQQYSADIGIMLSASHNHWQDNGVKLFNADGDKISDADQACIENNIHLTSGAETQEIGKARRGNNAQKRYKEHLICTMPRDFSFGRKKIVLDCANGAAYRVAPEIYRELGAHQLVVINTSPNGRNINLRCGATDVEALQSAVLTHEADIGLAFDGDADRLIAVDETGHILDGDQIMAAMVHHWALTNNFTGSLVCTVMSNKGLDRFLGGMNIGVERTDVGDRHVIARMKQTGALFGGEQSGHMVFREHGMVGDGILSSLKLMQVLREQDILASQLGKTFSPLVQIKHNIPLPEGSLDTQQICAEALSIVGSEGQVLVRPSGTEPILRLMVQAEDQATAERAMSSMMQALELTA